MDNPTLAFEIVQNKKLGYIDNNGNLIHQTKEKGGLHIVDYRGAINLNEIIAVKIGDLYGYRKRIGDVIIPPQFDMAVNFEGDRALIGKKIGSDKYNQPIYLWGYINTKGEIIIDYQYINAYSYYNEVALVQEQDKNDQLNQYISSKKLWYLIDQNGKIISHKFNWAKYFSEGRAPVEIDKRYGFINTKGEIIVEPQYDWVTSFKDNISRIAIKDDKYSNLANSIDPKTGFTIITPYFEGKFGVIDPSGNYIIQPIHQAANFHFGSEYNDFYEGLALIEKEGKYGFINLKGLIVIPPQFDNAWHFTEGLASVSINNKCGYINTKGEMVIEPKFIFGWGFSEGLAAIQKKVSILDEKTGKKKSLSKWGYISKTGEIVIEPQFSVASAFHDGLAMVYFDKKMAYINTKGKVIWIEK